MRVVYFSRDYTTHDHRFLEALSGTDHEVHFLRLENGGRALESRPVPAGVEVIPWWGGRRQFRWMDFPWAALALSKVLGRVQPDLVHAGPVQRSALLTAIVGFHPLVTMSWGSDLLLEANSGWGRRTARHALARSDVLLCDCDAVQQRAIELGMPAGSIAVFPWGVDLERFVPGDRGPLRSQLGWEQAIVLLSTRQWEPLLGIDLLVDGFIAASEGCPELRLLMLGSGSLKAEIRDQLTAAKMLDRVHFAGQVESDRLPEYYRAADLYVSASHSDGSSISLLEAMACGLPALVSDIPGNREWVEPDTNGWWFLDGDAAALTQGLIDACHSRDELGELGRRGRTVAESRANWSKNFPKLLDAYDSALANYQGSG